MKYKILVSDFDGTLARNDKSVSKETVNAINSFVERGGLFCVCTGRMTAGIDHIISDFKLNALVASFNGAELYDIKSNKSLHKDFVDNKTCVKFFRFCEKHNLNAQGYVDNYYIVRQKTERTDFYTKVCGVEAVVKNPISEYFLKSGKQSGKLLVFDTPEKIKEYYPIIKKEFSECNVFYSNDEQIDLNTKTSSKGEICKVIAEMNGLTLNDVIAVGDAGNDAPMLKSVGFPIAVGNAYKEIKNMCKVVVSDNEHDPIKEIIEKYCI